MTPRGRWAERWAKSQPAILTAAALALIVVALVGTGPRGQADIVLLDEYWAPEITVNDVVATEIDTKATGDATQARFGECSAQLTNETGAPNVRFRSAATIVLDQIPPGKSEADIWYRTDKWTGTWNLDIWVWHGPTDPAPIRVLTSALDGGGQDGALIADDQWHQAKGTLKACDAYEKVPHDKGLVSYVWLAPTSGWNIKHRTFVDRIEIKVLDGREKEHPAIAPATRIRPRPGAQVTGPGWVWWEGEDAVDSTVPHWGCFGPHNIEQQKVLSNGAWLQWHGSKDMTAVWEIDVPEAGKYAFWCRGLGGGFKWSWDDKPVQTCTADSPWTDTTKLDEFFNGPIEVSWACLGQVQLSAGKHVLQTEGATEDDVTGFDCWLLTTKPFTPHGTAKPEG